MTGRISPSIVLKIAPIVMAFAFLLVGCASKKAMVTPPSATQMINELFGAYDDACKRHDPNQARDALVRMANLQDSLKPEQRNTLTLAGGAATSFAAYGLLFCLDSARGHDDLAAADLIKARYWRLLSLELNHMPENSSVADARSLTGARLKLMMQKSDKSMLLTANPSSQSSDLK
jgi:hypothetical protein